MGKSTISGWILWFMVDITMVNGGYNGLLTVRYWKMTIEIVDLPNLKMVIFQFAMLNYQRVTSTNMDPAWNLRLGWLWHYDHLPPIFWTSKTNAPCLLLKLRVLSDHAWVTFWIKIFRKDDDQIMMNGNHSVMGSIHSIIHLQTFGSESHSIPWWLLGEVKMEVPPGGHVCCFTKPLYS